MNDIENMRTSLELDRRGFLSGVGIMLGGVPLRTLAGTAGGVGQAGFERALFMQLPYFSSDGSGAAYRAPRANRATRDYVNSLSREEFLRRHWRG